MHNNIVEIMKLIVMFWLIKNINPGKVYKQTMVQLIGLPQQRTHLYAGITWHDHQIAGG